MSPGSKTKRLRGYLMIDTITGGIIAVFIVISALLVFGYAAGHSYELTASHRDRAGRYDRLEDAIREKVFEDVWDDLH